MRRERDDGLAEAGENVPALRLDFDRFDDAVVSGAEAREVVVEILPDLLLFRRDGRDVDQCSRQIKYVHLAPYRKSGTGDDASEGE